MKPILFLDIDGVLNTFGSQPSGGLLGMNPEMVNRLERILDTVPTDVVLSSTWRMFPASLQRARMMIDSIGYEFHATTPEGGKTDGGLYLALRRGDEIKAWLALNPDRHFVVLDDDVYADEFPEANQVHTDGFDGALTEAKADEVIRKLSARSEPA